MEERFDKMVRVIYQNRGSFAGTLAAVQAGEPGPELLPGVERCLQRDFPEEYRRFAAVG
jgi:hypothetical protein